MRNAQRFDFTESFDSTGFADALPKLPYHLLTESKRYRFPHF